MIRHNVVRFAKNQKKDHIDLKMRVKIINVLLEQQLVERSQKVATIFDSINFIEASNNQANKEVDESLVRLETKFASNAILSNVQIDDPNVISSNNEIHEVIDSSNEIQQLKFALKRKI